MDKSSAVRVNLPILDVKIIGKSDRAAVEPTQPVEPEQKIEKPQSAVKIDKPVLVVKKLRTIASMGDPGDGDEPKDGDGDGLVFDNTPRERPAMLDFPAFVPKQISETWGQIHQQGLDKRREAARKRGLASGPRPTMREIREAIDTYDTDFLDALARQLFEHEGLGRDGRYRSEVNNVSTETSRGGKDVITVEGQIYDDADQEVGYFIRVIEPYGDDDYDDPSIYHEELTMTSGDSDARGLGIGSSFIMASELEYAATGFKRIHLTAALSDGPRAWARDDFDWKSRDDRERFLYGLIRTMNASPDKYFATKEERKAYRKMIEEALNEDINDPDRLRPVHFAMAPGFSQMVADRHSGSMRFKGEREVRNYSAANRESPVTELDQVTMTGAGEPEKYDSMSNIRLGNISSVAARPLEVDYDQEAETERQLLKDFFGKIGVSLDVDELDANGGWANAWKDHGDKMIAAVGIEGDFVGHIIKRRIDGQESASDLFDTFSNRWLSTAQFFLGEMSADIDRAKRNSLADKDYQAELLEYVALVDRVRVASPEERKEILGDIIGKSLAFNIVVIDEQIKRHPEFRGRVSIGGPRPGAPANVGASTMPLLTMKPGSDKISLNYQLSLGGSVGSPRVYDKAAEKLENFGIGGSQPMAVLAHEFGHALENEAAFARAGINTQTDDLIGDFARRYPALKDSIPGIIQALRAPNLDPSTKITDMPAASLDALGDAQAVSGTQLDFAFTLLALVSPNGQYRPVKIPGENALEEEPTVYSMDFSPEFVYLLKLPSSNGGLTQSQRAAVAKTIEQSAMKNISDLDAYAKDLSKRLQELLYEATDRLGIHLQSYGDTREELIKKAKGLTLYGNTSPQEFLAEAHAMIELLENYPGYKIKPQHQQMVKKVRTLYEYMLDPDRPLELGVMKSASAKLTAAVNEASILSRELQKVTGK